MEKNKRSFLIGFQVISIGCVLMLSLAPCCMGGLITFSDQADGDGPMQRAGSSAGNVYASAQGLPTGITATFDGFNRIGPSGGLLDVDHTRDVNWRAIYGNADNATISFRGGPVTVDSVSVKNDLGNYPADPSSNTPAYLVGIVGLFEGQIVWTFQFRAETFDDFSSLFFDVTSGIGLPVDKVVFTNVAAVFIDDIAVNSTSAVPEPRMGLAVVVAAASCLRRRRAPHFSSFPQTAPLTSGHRSE